MAPTYRVGLLVAAGGVNATVFDLPGCATFAPDRQSIEEATRLAISEYLSWLKRHGSQAASRDRIDVQVVAEVDAADTEAADGEICFEDDRIPASKTDVDEAIVLMEHSRDDLLSLIESIEQTILTWRPPPSAMERIDEWAPEIRSIQDIVDHVASSDDYYVSGLGDGPVSPPPDHDRPDLQLQRLRAIERLRLASSEELGRVFHPQREWQDRPEQWTMRKVLRRILSHERFHTAEIQQRLSWFLVGVPNFRAGT